MATAQTIVDRAARLVGGVASGVSVTAAEGADGLIALNAMIESWQTDKLFVYALTDTAFNTIANDGSYTVGPAGNFALTPRPHKIEECFIRVSDDDIPVRIVESDEWFAIPDKTATAEYPDVAYYEPSLTTGTLLVYPVPTAINGLHIVTWTVISSLATLATSIAMPPGYERALAFNLAIEWAAPEFGHPASKEVVKIAQDSMAAIKRANHRSIMNYSPMGQVFATPRANIITGDA